MLTYCRSSNLLFHQTKYQLNVIHAFLQRITVLIAKTCEELYEEIPTTDDPNNLHLRQLNDDIEIFTTWKVLNH